MVATAVLSVVLLACLATLIAVDRRQPAQAPFPWLWVLPAVLVVGLSGLVGVVQYPALASQIPVHFDLHGEADRWAATTPFSALFPVVLQALTTALLAVSAALVLRVPGGDTARLQRTARATMVLATGLDLALFLVAEPIWQGHTRLPGGILLLAALCLGAGVVAILVASFGSGTAPPAEGRWRGIFYVDRGNPALFVPKRFGIGWTINLGHPAGWPLLITLLAVPVLAAVLGTLTV